MWNQTDLRAALIDLDGTLVDTLGDFELALGGMLDELGLPGIEAGFIARTVGKGGEHLVRQTLAHVGAEPTRFEAAWASYQRHYDRINGRAARVFEGVVPGLQALRDQGWPLVCLTNKPQAPAQTLLQVLGLAPFFTHCYGGDSFARKKPDPMPLLGACEALGLPPQQVLMVGDSRNDAEAARAAGCPVVLLRYGYNHGEPVEAVGADGVLDSLAQLPRWLQQAC